MALEELKNMVKEITDLNEKARETNEFQWKQYINFEGNAIEDFQLITGTAITGKVCLQKRYDYETDTEKIPLWFAGVGVVRGTGRGERYFFEDTIMRPNKGWAMEWAELYAQELMKDIRSILFKYAKERRISIREFVGRYSWTSLDELIEYHTTAGRSTYYVRERMKLTVKSLVDLDLFKMEKRGVKWWIIRL